MANRYKVAYGLSNGAIFNDLEPDLVFKVTPFFDIKYLTNGDRYGYSYYKRRIKNRTYISFRMAAVSMILSDL